MQTPVVPFEQVHPRETWPVEPCEVCGTPTRAMPDHPGFMVVLCDRCRNAPALEPPDERECDGEHRPGI